MREWGARRWDSEPVQMFGRVFPRRQVRETGDSRRRCGATGASLRHCVPACLVVMGCPRRARGDAGAGEEGDNDRSKVLELAKGDGEPCGGGWRWVGAEALRHRGSEDGVCGLGCR